jgi:hypothetical protein
VKEGVFEFADGSRPNVTFWEHNPNDAIHSEDCAAMVSVHQTWADYNCESMHFASICEKAGAE